MQLTMFEQETEISQALFFGKMCPAYSTQTIMLSDAFWANCPATMASFERRGADGQTRVWCLAPSAESRGESWMPNISAWPNDASVCLLSQVLERGSIPQRYYLSSTACAGILRRAEKRGKELPPMLREALSQWHMDKGGAEIGFDRGPTLTCNHEAPILCAEISPTVTNGPPFSRTGANRHGVAHAFKIRGGRPDPVNDARMTLGVGSDTDPQFTLQAAHSHAVATQYAVRRLTPVECERLQGFPDGFTNIPWRGKPDAPDGPRYKALGNSWAVPVVRWIGERINDAVA